MKNKDWTGNKRSVYGTIGASNHTDKDREENDYYATSPKAVELLLDVETFDKNIWECAAGEDHIANVLRKHGHIVWSTDIIDRTGYTEIKDFLTSNEKFNGDIITNPPYKYAQDFVEHAIETVETGNKVAMYLKLTFLEGKKRQRLFKQRNLKTVYVMAGRMGCAKNGEFYNKEEQLEQGAVAFAWFVWEKGYIGDPIIKWLNN
jgi:hypothetical protein